MGFDHIAFTGINIRQGSADLLTAELSAYSEVLEVRELQGRFYPKILARILDELRSLVVSKIRSIPQVAEVELMTVLNAAKEESMVYFEEAASWTDADAV